MTTLANAKWPSTRLFPLQILGIFDDDVVESGIVESAVHSRAMFRAAMILSQEQNITVEDHHIGWQIMPFGGDLLDSVNKTCDVISISDIAGIILPSLSRQNSLIANFARKIRVPVLSYGPTNFEISDRSSAKAITSLFLRFKWTRGIIICQNDVFGSNGERIMQEEFQNHNLSAVNTILFDTATNSIRGNLKTLLTSSASRIVVLWVDSNYTPVILQQALDADVVGPHFTWIIRSRFSLDTLNETYSSQLIGMFLLEPTTPGAVNGLINTTLMDAAYSIWNRYEPETFPSSDDVSSSALFAFDAVWFLIQALNNFCSMRLDHSKPCLVFEKSSSCFKYQLLNADAFIDTIHKMKFLGVSGPVKFHENSVDQVIDTYYVLYNYQFLSNKIQLNPILTYADQRGWQPVSKPVPIIWPGYSLEPSKDSPELEGITLRIGIGGIIPFTIINTVRDPSSDRNMTKLTGYAPDLIELLRTKLKFIPDLQLVPTDITNEKLMQMVANGTYDIIISDLTVTAARREIVHFSNSIFDTSTYVMMRDTRDINIDLLSFLKPFSRNLWLLIFGVTMYAAIILCILERERNEHLQTRSVIARVVISFWYCFGTLVGYGVDFDVRTDSGRVLTAGLYILSIVLVASYTANLASDLVVWKSKNVITGIDDIKSGKMPFHRIGIIPDTSIEDYYLREVSRGIKNYYPLASADELLDALKNGIIDACLLDSGFSEYLINNIYCGLTLVGQHFDVGIFGIATPKGWLYTEDFDVTILSLRESGDIERLKTSWFNSKSCPEMAETSTALGIDSMGGLFLVFGIISILSILLFGLKKFSLLKKLHLW